MQFVWQKGMDKTFCEYIIKIHLQIAQIVKPSISKGMVEIICTVFIVLFLFYGV